MTRRRTHGIVRATIAGICLERGVAQRPKTALLVGFAGALRRSELVGLDVADVGFEAEGLVLQLNRSKTNQEGELEEVVLYGSDPKNCPVCALQAWLATSAIIDGPLFRAVDRAGRIGSGRLEARIVGERVNKILERRGLDPGELRGALAAQRLRDIGGAGEFRSRDNAPGALREHPGRAPLYPCWLALDDHPGTDIGL